MQRKVNMPRKGEVNVTEIMSRLHSAKVSLLRPEKVNEIVNRVREAKDIDDAIYAVLEVHGTPLTFNDIMSLMREDDKHPERITRALERLIRQRKVHKVIVIMPEGCFELYAKYAEAQIYIGIPVRLLRELGYGVWVGSANEGQREPYDLDLVEDDYLVIHIDRIGDQSSEGPSRKGAQEARGLVK
jgi:predicted Zn-ribbon and HTH transcriptional regulator